MRLLASFIVAVFMILYCGFTKILMIGAANIVWWLGWVVLVLSLTILIYMSTKR